MMKQSRRSNKLILLTEATGFGVLLFITWLDEGVALPRHWLGTWFGPGTFHEAILESIAIIIVGTSVTLYTNYLLNRLYYLENFLRVCAWCKKIHFEDKWISMEEYLKHAGNIECSHGICEVCEEKVKQEYEDHRSASAKIQGMKHESVH